jgi:hypothetical protein
LIVLIVLALPDGLAGLFERTRSSSEPGDTNATSEDNE